MSAGRDWARVTEHVTHCTAPTCCVVATGLATYECGECGEDVTVPAVCRRCHPGSVKS